MAPFKTLHGRKCRSPLCWDKVIEHSILGPELITQAKEQVKIIRECMKIAQDKQKK